MIRPRRPIVMLSGILMLTGAAPAIGAAPPEVKEAKKVLKKKGEKVLEDYAAVLKARRIALNGALDTIDAELDAGLAGLSSVVDLFDAIVEFQSSTWGDWQSVQTATGAVVDEAVGILAGGGITDADLPRDFQFGTGGKLDQHYADLDQELDKTYAKVRKRVAKTAERFESKEGIGVLFQIGPAIHIVGSRHSVSAGTGWWQSLPQTFDTMVTASDLSQTNDGILLGAGTGWWTAPLEAKRITNSSTAVAATMATWRWEFAMSGLAEGNDQVIVYPTGGSVSQGISRPYCVR